jgi:hypothetical protein
MGYYSLLEFDIEDAIVDMKKKEEIERRFSENDGDIYGFRGVELSTDENGKLIYIELEEYFAKFYDDELFADMLKDALIAGRVDLYFTGEDGNKSGIRIEPGKTTPLCCVWVPCE